MESRERVLLVLFQCISFMVFSYTAINKQSEHRDLGL